MQPLRRKFAIFIFQFAIFNLFRDITSGALG